MYTLSAQTEQRNFEDTRRRLEQARELILAFAIVNGRLPCPAQHRDAPHVAGDEVVTTASAASATQCTTTTAAPAARHAGLLPARTIGYQQVDPAGFAVDAWGNRIRYVVSRNSDPPNLLGQSIDARPAFHQHGQPEEQTASPASRTIC